MIFICGQVIHQFPLGDLETSSMIAKKYQQFAFIFSRCNLRLKICYCLLQGEPTLCHDFQSREFNLNMWKDLPDKLFVSTIVWVQIQDFYFSR